MAASVSGKAEKLKKKPLVFIDGSAGTTGLKVASRLAERDDIRLLILDEEHRKDISARKEAINSADVAFICLPDVAAIEAVSLCDSPKTVIIDTSTAHRCAEGWTYGFPEIGGLKTKIAKSRRIANPGCHASGFIALIAPLVERGLIKPSLRLATHSLTGFSGGGKKMIADYEDSKEDVLHCGGRQYALGQHHKHLPEMVKYCGLKNAPCFSPIVVPHYSGMEVSVPLFAKDVKGGIEAIKDCYRDYYKKGLVRFVDDSQDGGFLSSAALSGRDDMEISVYGNKDRLMLVALFDNLGKGASGAAIQNMNIALGMPEKTGLKA